MLTGDIVGARNDLELARESFARMGNPFGKATASLELVKALRTERALGRSNDSAPVVSAFLNSAADFETIGNRRGAADAYENAGRVETDVERRELYLSRAGEYYKQMGDEEGANRTRN
jgi:hypothetical protein